MAFISLVPEERVDPALESAYQKLRESYGIVPNYFRAIARMPKLIDGHFALGEVLKEGALPRRIKEQIGLVVSGINSSSYCVAIHMEVLRNLGIEKPVGRKLATDYESAPVEEKVKVLYRFADKLTRKPYDVTQADANGVLQAGWTEAALFETVVTVALFNLYNRVSTGLGLMADF